MIKLSSRSRKKVTIYYASVALWALLILTWYHYNYNYNYKSETLLNHSIYDMYDDHYNNQQPSSPKLSGTSNTGKKFPPSLADTATETDSLAENGDDAVDGDDLLFPNFKNTTVYQNLLDDYNLSKQIDFHSTVYDSIFQHHSMDSVLGNLNFQQRCDLFFKHIFLNNPNWIFDPTENYNVVWGAPFETYKKMHKEELEKAYAKQLQLKQQQVPIKEPTEVELHLKLQRLQRLERQKEQALKVQNAQPMKQQNQQNQQNQKQQQGGQNSPVQQQNQYGPLQNNLNPRDVVASFVDTPDYKEFQRSSYTKWKSHESDQKIVDNVSVLRLYNKCYLSNDEPKQQQQTAKFIKQQKSVIRQIDDDRSQIPKFVTSEPEQRIADVDFSEVFQRRVYPWLSYELPVFERWTGEIFNSPPNYRDILNDPTQPLAKSYSSSSSSSSASWPTSLKQSNNFLRNFKHACQGKGIVLSIADKHVEYTVSLIHLLRALNNKLPIQIVYHDNLNDDTKRQIVTAAREDFSHLPQSFQKIAHLFPSDYLDPKSKGLPKQEVWFVNTASVINERYKSQFGGFANKLLATFFNSFNEMMVIDADTVMMQDPKKYFQLQGYKDTGTFFFRDRAVIQNRHLSDGQFFHKISQSTVDSLMFDVPLLTDFTLRRDYFRGLLHTMESGMVLINRPLHFNSILMVVHMNFMHPLKRLSYGDKELYWLGFALAGDENYHFNKHGAAAIGEMTNPHERPRPDGTLHNSKELCSPHPGHISEENNHTLLWINSGFRFCHQAPMVNFNKEITFGSRLKSLPQTIEAFRAFYYSPLRIKTAIVPPQDPEIHHRRNIQDEPTHGWLMDQNYCQKYLWCGYSSIGGKVNDHEDNTMEGLVIEYGPKERAMFDYLGDIWIGVE
ncbi:MNN13 [Candida theae]|uniref:MNN13 n=1 Tax=Candida theae TaxID=1198502 RepID=A0AAD5FWP3_9ASCO|nr:MNN13 [Candida theae]KAI5949121.1 MNN13 [Candida theae]